MLDLGWSPPAACQNKIIFIENPRNQPKLLLCCLADFYLYLLLLLLGLWWRLLGRPRSAPVRLCVRQVGHQRLAVGEVFTAGHQPLDVGRVRVALHVHQERGRQQVRGALTSISFLVFFL